MDPLTTPNPPPERIYWWARQHALILMIGITAAWLERSGLLLAAMAGASLLAAFRIPRPTPTQGRKPFWGTLLSASRILIALGLIAEPQTDAPITLGALAFLTALQILQAWLNRDPRKHPIEQQLIEQETDELWLTCLAFLIAPLTPLGNGIIWLAILRPLWVMASHWTGPPPCVMPWSFSWQLASGITLLALSAPLAPGIPASIAQGLMAVGGLGWTVLHAFWVILALKRKR